MLDGHVCLNLMRFVETGFYLFVLVIVPITNSNTGSRSLKVTNYIEKSSNSVFISTLYFEINLESMFAKAH